MDDSENNKLIVRKEHGLLSRVNKQIVITDKLLAKARRSKVLVIAEKDYLGGMLEWLIKDGGFDVNVVESWGRLDEVYSELERQEYDMVIPTNNSLSLKHILELIPGIKAKYPSMRIVVLSGWDSSDFVEELKKYSIDEFFKLPVLAEKLLSRIKELLSSLIR